MPKVSIIAPVYKVETRVGWCINSILKQNYRDFELILVNDGSPDDSLRILRNYEKLDSRVRVLDIPNQGVSNARNTGMQAARGEYIQFVDSDDVVDPDYTQTLLETLEMYDADTVICGISVEHMGTDGRIAARNALTCEQFGKECVLEGKVLFENLPFLVWASCTVEGPCNRIYKRSLIEKQQLLRFPEGMHYGEDFLFNLEYLDRCCRAVFLQKTLYHYMMWPGESLARKYVPNLYQGQKRQLVRLRRLVEEHGALTDANRGCMANYEVGQIVKSMMALVSPQCPDSLVSKKQQLCAMVQDPLVQEAFADYQYLEPQYMAIPRLVVNRDVGGLLQELNSIGSAARALAAPPAPPAPPAPRPGLVNRMLVKVCRGLQKLFRKGFIHKWARITELNLTTVGLKTTMKRIVGKLTGRSRRWK